jgi:c-di-GMP-binding flagellar brake protein YcgR
MSDPKNAEERRKQARRALKGSARIMLSTGQIFVVRTTDISVEGVGVVAAANPKNGTTFKIQVTLPTRPTGTTTFEASAKVVHSILAGEQDGFKIGLMFGGLTPEIEAAIRKYVG